jgi:hypothetical protein
MAKDEIGEGDRAERRIRGLSWTSTAICVIRAAHLMTDAAIRPGVRLLTVTILAFVGIAFAFRACGRPFGKDPTLVWLTWAALNGAALFDMGSDLLSSTLVRPLGTAASMVVALAALWLERRRARK